MEPGEKEARGYKGSTLMCTDELCLNSSLLDVCVPVCNDQISVDGEEQKTSGGILLTWKQWTLPCLCSVSHDYSLLPVQRLTYLPPRHQHMDVSITLCPPVSNCPSLSRTLEQFILLSLKTNGFLNCIFKKERHKCDHLLVILTTKCPPICPVW